VINYRRLKVFRLADSLCVELHAAASAQTTPQAVTIGCLMLELAVRTCMAIVVGSTRDSKRDFARELAEGYRTNRELGYLIELAGRLGCVETQQQEKLARLQKETSRILAVLIRNLGKGRIKL